MNSRINRQIDLALGTIEALVPDLKPGVDFAASIQTKIGNIRGAGARDRRFYREIIYTWLRFREWLDPYRNTDTEMAAILLIFLAGKTPELMAAKAKLPEPLRNSVQAGASDAARLLTSFDPEATFVIETLVPDWLNAEFPDDTTRLPHVLERPPIWIRTTPDTVREICGLLHESGVPASNQPNIPGAISVPTDSNLENIRAFKAGRFHIQDIGSQAVITQVDPKVGEHWLDACAGAGGKSLQLASLLGYAGKVTATDIRRSALQNLRTRAQRTRPGNLVILEPRNAESADILYDGVLVDAPCSGSGTWRRRPFLRHQTNLEIISQFSRVQQEILNRSADRVRPSGRLVYATCSLCRTENEKVVSAFLNNHHDFHPERIPNRLGLTEIADGQFLILPENLNGDGYYLASLKRR
jgi:16S rRNA (cytosine967-C5)-methyltransferase